MKSPFLMSTFIFLFLSFVLTSEAVKYSPALATKAADLQLSDGMIADRRFSLSGPYDTSLSPDWTALGSTVLLEEAIRLTPDSPSRFGVLGNNNPSPFTSWKLDFSFSISGGTFGADGLAIWYVEEPLVGGVVFGGGPAPFKGVVVAFDTFDNDGDGQHPLVLLLQNDGFSEYEAVNDAANIAAAGCTGFHFRNTREPIVGSLVYNYGHLKLFLKGRTTYLLCFDVALTLPAGYHFGYSASTGDVSDKHDLIYASLFNLAPGAEDPEVLKQLSSRGSKSNENNDDPRSPPHLHSSDLEAQNDQDDSSAPPHKHVLPTPEEVIDSLQKGPSNFADDPGAPPHEHVELKTKSTFVAPPLSSEGNSEGIASKNLADAVSDEKMVFFKWRKRFEKTRQALRDIGEHDDDQDIDHPFDIPETALEEPTLDTMLSPEDVAELYDILAEEIWLVKKMQHDTMKMIAQMQEGMRHQGDHNDEQHRIFAVSLEKLLREVATRHTVEDALKEQLLRFETQRNNLHALSTQFAGDIGNLKTEFESVSHTVRSKVSASQEILSTQLKDLTKEFYTLKESLTTSIQNTVQRALDNNLRSQQQYQTAEDCSSDWGLGTYLLVAFQVCFLLILCYFIFRGAKGRRSSPFHT